MITYLYWIGLFLLVAIALYFIGFKANRWAPALAVAGIIFIAGWTTHAFYLEQIFVKRWGGRMGISIEEGHHHLGATWKDDNLWVENYDPETNTCYFKEYSRGNVLEGQVIFKNCNPLMPRP